MLDDWSRIASYLAIITTGEVSIKGALNFKLQAFSCFVNVTQEVINKMEGSTILKSTKDATKFGVTLFKRKKTKFLLIELIKPITF